MRGVLLGARGGVGARHPFVTLTGRHPVKSIGDAGAAALAEALKVNKTVTTIRLISALCAECCWAGAWNEPLVVVRVPASHACSGGRICPRGAAWPCACDAPQNTSARGAPHAKN